MNEWLPNWIRNGWRTKSGEVLNKALIQYLNVHITQRAALGQKVILEYVKGHAGIEGNEGADHMANIGATMPEEPDRDWDALREKLQSSAPNKKARIMAPAVVVKVCLLKLWKW
jgi:ribonuclease HI